MVYDPYANGLTNPPPICYALCALGLFIYQSLDAIGNYYHSKISYSYAVQSMEINPNFRWKTS